MKVDQYAQSKNISKKSFSEKNLNKIFYFNGIEAINDLLYFKIFKSNIVDPHLLQLIKNFNKKKEIVESFKSLKVHKKNLINHENNNNEFNYSIRNFYFSDITQ